MVKILNRTSLPLRAFIAGNRTLSVFLLFLFLYLALGSGHIGGDGLWIYFSAESLIRDGDLNLMNQATDFQVQEMQENIDYMRGRIAAQSARGDDAVYTKYGLLMILLYVPFYLLGHLFHAVAPIMPHDYMTVFFVSLANCVVSAFLVTYLYLFTREITGDEKRSLLLAAVLGIGTYIVEYALKSGFSEPLQGLTVFASFYHAFRFMNTRRNRHLVYSGLFAAASIVTKFYSFIIIGWVCLYAFWKIFHNSESDRKIARFLSFAVPLAGGIALFALFNYVRYGTVFEQGYADMYARSKLFDFTLLHIAARAFDFLVSPGKGVVLFAPVVLLGINGMKAMYRTHRDESIVCAGVFLTVFLFFASSTMWAGEWSWGPRYLYSTIPFVILPVGALLVTGSHERWEKAVGFLFMLGILVQLPGVVMNNSDFIRFSQKAGFGYYRLTLSQFSPVFGGYVRLASGVNRLVTGKSLSYPVSYTEYEGEKEYLVDIFSTGTEYVSLAGYDRFDLWVSNIWTVAKGRTAVKIIIIPVFLIMLLLPVWWYRLLRGTFRRENL